jgi:hypothetical protein
MKTDTSTVQVGFAECDAFFASILAHTDADGSGDTVIDQIIRAEAAIAEYASLIVTDVTKEGKLS